jgi:hypothetical protein
MEMGVVLSREPNDKDGNQTKNDCFVCSIAMSLGKTGRKTSGNGFVLGDLECFLGGSNKEQDPTGLIGEQYTN